MEDFDSCQKSHLGGVVKVEMAPVSSVSWFLSIGRRALISLKSGAAWLSLPFVDQKTQVDESFSDEEGFAITTSKLTIPIHHVGLAYDMTIKDHLWHGALIKVTFGTGETKVYGSRRHPLTGSLLPIHGTKFSSAPYDLIEVSSPGEGLLLGG